MVSADNATCTLDLNHSFIVDGPPILLVDGIDDTYALDKGREARCIYSLSQILNECFLFFIVFNFDLRRQEGAMKN